MPTSPQAPWKKAEHVRQILETVLPSRHVRFDLHETYRPRDDTTKYLESDFDFAARLMEENGIYYYFECTADNDVMVIADRSLLGPEIGTNSVLDFDPVGGGTRGRWRVRDWKTGLTLRSSKHVMRDHSFQLPTKSTAANESTTSPDERRRRSMPDSRESFGKAPRCR